MAPRRHLWPIEIFSSFPPESVPMVEEPPPRSESLPTNTPDDILPSIILGPSVPALKFMNPSCITVVPAPRYAPNLTRDVSAILTFSGIT